MSQSLNLYLLLKRVYLYSYLNTWYKLKKPKIFIHNIKSEDGNLFSCVTKMIVKGSIVTYTQYFAATRPLVVWILAKPVALLYSLIEQEYVYSMTILSVPPLKTRV